MYSPTHNNGVRHMKLRLLFATRFAIVVYVLAAIVGCATQSPKKGEPTAAELDVMGEKAVATLLENLPEVREVMDRSVGYVVVNMRVSKIPMVGAGGGYGVVVDKRSNARSYIKVSRFEVGGGLGAQKFKVVIVYEDGKLLDRAAAGTWHYDASADVAADAASGEGAATASGSGEGYQVFRLAEGGATATVTLRAARAKPYLRD